MDVCSHSCDYAVLFFFQAEDGIGDRLVTGVQTCALPISCTSTPQNRLNADTRRYSSSRSGSVVTWRKPTCFRPVAWPVSASRRAERARVYLRISVHVFGIEAKGTMRRA